MPTDVTPHPDVTAEVDRPRGRSGPLYGEVVGTGWSMSSNRTCGEVKEADADALGQSLRSAVIPCIQGVGPSWLIAREGRRTDIDVVINVNWKRSERERGRQRAVLPDAIGVVGVAPVRRQVVDLTRVSTGRETECEQTEHDGSDSRRCGIDTSVFLCFFIRMERNGLTCFDSDKLINFLSDELNDVLPKIMV